MLRTDALTFKPDNSTFELKDVSIHIHEGEVVSLIGPNGSGKSTLLRTIARLNKANSGEVFLNDKNIKTMKPNEVAQQLAMLPQMNNHQLDLTVRELVEFGRHPHLPRSGKMSKEDIELVDWAIEVTGLTHLQSRILPAMSGGERQRAWIAMTIAQNPKILLLDEPTTYLDISHQLEVMELVKELNAKYNMTVVMVLHDINQAAQYSDRLIVLKRGSIHYDGLPHCVMCREMFQAIFEIDADIYQKDGRFYFTPMKLCKPECSQ